ncbi:hypothetical protein [Streptomyces sp. NPDC088752]|uniref:hypothetical protein n=1 Tax=Streptomyces sp. NPDC088752 TaxID=3154963 RepID=UPI0034370345
MPGDWDGGWRRAAPQPLTLSRAPLGVSDGLAFRAGLAAWQNPSFDGGMGHALLPTAPTGLVHGMTRPAAPHATDSGGGPLLLRAVRAGGAGAEADAPGPEARLPSASGKPGTPKAPKAASKGPEAPRTPEAPKASKTPETPDVSKVPETSKASKSPGTPKAPGASKTSKTSKTPTVQPSAPVVRPSPGGASGTADSPERRSPDGRPPSRDLSTATSPAVLSTPAPAVQRAVAPSDAGRSPVAPPIPLVRRVAVVPVAPGARDTSVRGSATGTAGRTVTEKSASRKDTAEKGAVASGAPGGDRPEPSSRPVVRPRPVGPRLTVARRVPGDARQMPALRPAAPAAPRRDGAAAVADAPEAVAPSRSSTAGAEGPGRTAPGPAVQRAATRTVLGPPLAELPSSAVPSAGNVPAGPGLPFVQRQAEDAPRSATGVPAPSAAPVSPRRSGARARGGLGAPLSAMPPSAGPPAGSPAPGVRPGRPAPGPAVQRAPAPSSPAGGRPAPGPETAAPHAPLLGTTDVQRRITDRPAPRGDGSADRSSDGAPAARAPGPALPPVTPSGTAHPAPQAPAGRDVVRPDTAPTGPGPVDDRRLAGPTGPAPVVVARAVSGPGTSAPGAASAGDRRGTTGPAGTPVPKATIAPKTTGPAGTPVPKATTGPPEPVRTSAAPTSAPTSGPRSAAPASGVSSGSGARPATAASGEGSRASTARARRPGTASVPVARRTLALLPGRPLTLSTRTPEGLAPSAASRPASGPPVVAARWSTAQDAPGGASDRPARTSPPGGGAAPAPVQRAAPETVRRAAPHPVQPTASAPAPPPRGAPAPGASGRSGASGSAVPPPSVQRAATAYGPPRGDGEAGTGAPTAVRRVPVVKPVPPGGGTSAATTGSPARPLPVAPPQAPPVAGGPPAPVSPAPGAAVPVVRPRAAAPGVRPASGAAPQIQRAVPDTGKGPSATPAAPVKEVPARGKQTPSPASAGTGGSAGRNTGRSAGPAQDPGLDLDDLARRLLDPMARLLRTELRRGRERTGRPYDGRR